MTTDVEVCVKRGGKVIATILRPLRELNGLPAVTYKGQLYVVERGCISIGAACEPALTEQGVDVAANGSPLASKVDAGSPAGPGIEDLRENASTWKIDPISEPPFARVIVDAGPGTGKTHAACARVAAMIADDVSATRILLISFTRTAVAEIRSRIARSLTDPADASSVRIVTLDAFAWSVQSGYALDAKLTGKFEDNIERARRLIEEDLDVQEDLARIEHLIIDEAQDIVGVRADLVLSLIESLDEGCGVTVFADRAQAIYGFNEGPRRQSEGTNLLDDLEARGYRPVELRKVHRTSDPNLLAIFTGLRHEILSTSGVGLESHVRKEIQRLAHGNLEAPNKLNLAEVPEDSLVLLRNRLDVLNISSFSGTSPHRLRLSGLPACIRPWVGGMFWDYVQRRINRSEFENLWDDRKLEAPYGPDEAWARCIQVAGESAQVVDLHKLRNALARPNPPMLFCSAEFGHAGPIVGTIHASKGREASNVYLYLPAHPSADATGEESRVMFVGATRPRDRLLVGATGSAGCFHTDGRVWRRVRKNLQIEVGRPSDIEASGLVGRSSFARQEAALASQFALNHSPVRDRMVISSQESLDWRFALNSGDLRLAVMSERFKSDMDNIGHQAQARIAWLGHCRSLGVRTMAVSPESSAAEQLLEPWKSSGFLFAPLLSSLSLAPLRPR